MLSKPLATVALLSGLLSPILAAPVDPEPGFSDANPLLVKRDCSSTGSKQIEPASMDYSSKKTVGQLTIEIGNAYCQFQDTDVTGDYFYGPYIRVTNTGDCEATLSIAKSKTFDEDDNRRSWTFYDGKQYVGCFAYSQSYSDYVNGYYYKENPIWERAVVIGTESGTDSLSESKAEKKGEPQLVIKENLKDLKEAGVQLCKGKPNKKHPCKKH